MGAVIFSQSVLTNGMALRIKDDCKPVWEFNDYRTYLKEAIVSAKAAGRPISNRWFAKELGVNSSAFITLVLQGKRNLNKNVSARLARLLDLSKSEGAYFESLVEFNQARKLADRDRCYRALLLLRKRGDPQQLSADQYEFYSTWHHSAVRALVHLMRSPENHAELATMLVPAISESQARRSMELLEGLGLVRRNQRGKLELSTAAITTGDDVKSLQVANFQRETLKLAWEALDRVPKDDRDISTLTLTISKTGLKELRDLIKGFREQAESVARRDLLDDQVFQLNVQLFPLSRRVKKAILANG